MTETGLEVTGEERAGKSVTRLEVAGVGPDDKLPGTVMVGETVIEMVPVGDKVDFADRLELGITVGIEIGFVVGVGLTVIVGVEL